MKKITICENALEPSTSRIYEVEHVGDFLIDHFGAWPETARVYQGYVSEVTEVTPHTEAEVERLFELDDLIVVVYPGVFGLGLMAWMMIASVAINVAILVINYLNRPQQKNQHEQSPTNSLTNRQNRERPMERIPDIYGTIWAVPDLIQLPYRVFIGNTEYEYCYMCIGRGYYDIAEVRDDVTPVNNIDGMSVAVYGPFTSPNSGDSPIYTAGEMLVPKIRTVKQYSSANGQVLRAPNAKSFKANNNVAFVYSDVIESSAQVDFNDYFAEGSQIIVKNATVRDPAGAQPSVNLDGTYAIASIQGNQIILVNPAAVNANWSQLQYYSGQASLYCNPTLSSPDSGWVGPFLILEPDTTEIWCNVVCPTGLFEFDKEANQHSMTVTVQVGIQAIDSSHNPVGTEVFYSGTIIGSADLKTQRAVTIKCTLPIAGPCQVRMRRTSNTDLRDGWTVSDQTQWRDLYAVSPTSKTHFGNVTTIHVVTKPTQDALAIKSRKINCLISRKLQTHIAAAQNDATGHLTFTHSAPLGNWSWAVKWSNFTIPTLPIDAVVQGIYAVLEGTRTGTVHADAAIYAASNASLNPHDVSPVGAFSLPGGVSETSNFSGQAHSSSKGTSLSLLPGLAMAARLFQTASIPTMDDVFDISKVAFAIYYTSATPVIDPAITPPISVPAGQGLAFSYPSEVIANSANVGATNGSASGTIYSTNPESFDFDHLVSSKNAADIIIAMAMDPHIGNRLFTELDTSRIYAIAGLGGEVETYFGTPLCAEFCYAFDDSKISFEEMLAEVAQAVFCTAYRRGNLISLNFERATSNSTILFNHRNKLPNSEVRTVRFGTNQDADGIQLDYVDPKHPNQPDMDAIHTLDFPEDGSAVAPKKVTAVGVRNNVQAKILGWRLFNQLRYQKMAVEFQSTQEAAPAVLRDRILVADNTRPDTQDGEILAQDVLELTLSQPVTFVGGRSYTIFLQHYDATVESIAITEGSAPNKVVLAQAPSIPLVLDNTNYARTTYQIVDDSPTRKEAFILTEKSPEDGLTYSLKAVNYDDRYYEHDQDFIDGTVTENGGGGYNSGYAQSSQQQVYVDGKTRPWISADNPSYSYGVGDGKEPVVVKLLDAPGMQIQIDCGGPGDFISWWIWSSFRTNTVSAGDDHPFCDANGDPTKITGSSNSAENGVPYPTKYVPGSSLGLCGLFGAFAHYNSGTGKYEVLQALDLGFGGTYTIPSTATHLLLGINDDKFRDNQGGFMVTVTQTGIPGDPLPTDDGGLDPVDITNNTYYIITVDGA